MATEIIKNEIYEVVNGVASLVTTIETEQEVKSQAELIAEKEAALLALYDELKALKGE